MTRPDPYMCLWFLTVNLLLTMVVSCKKSGKLDLVSADVRFINPSSQVYTNTAQTISKFR